MDMATSFLTIQQGDAAAGIRRALPEARRQSMVSQIEELQLIDC